MEDLLTLKSLAYNRSTLARASLFEKVAGLWLDDAAVLSEASHEVMDQILVDLVKDVEVAVRTRIAEGLAAKTTVPAKLVEALAADHDIAVSGPLLAQCASLAEKFLIRVCRNAGVVHRQAIAMRADVPRSLSEALCERREATVMRTLVANPGARLSRTLFREAMALAKDDETLRESLLARGDLPKDFAYRMFWWVSAALRRQILEKHAVEPAALDSILRDMLADANEDRLAIATAKASTRTAPKPFNAIAHALNGAGLRAFVQELAASAGILPEMAARIVNDPSGECMAVISKSLGADRAQFCGLMTNLQAKRGGKTTAPIRLEEAVAAFEAVTAPRARTVLAVWNAQALAA